jgi:hypothetical protein
MLGSMTPRISSVATQAELRSALGEPGGPAGAMALVGGADGLEVAEVTSLRALFDRLARYLDETGRALIDGGTDSGIMRMIGEARRARGGTFRLIGVVPSGALERTTSTGSPITIESGHSEVLLVPGTRFGDETDWLFGAADHLGGGVAPTLVINGGGLTLDEARLRLEAGRTVVAVAGSGRAADELAADEGLRASGRLRVIPLSADESEIAASLAD